MNTIGREVERLTKDELARFGVCVHSRELDVPRRAYGPLLRVFWNGANTFRVCEYHTLGWFEVWESFTADAADADAAEGVAKAYLDRMECEMYDDDAQERKRARAMNEIYCEG